MLTQYHIIFNEYTLNTIKETLLIYDNKSLDGLKKINPINIILCDDIIFSGTQMNTKLKKINDYLKPIDKVYLNIIGMCNYSLSNIGYILDDSMKIQNTVLKNYNSFNFKLNIINQDKIIINTEEFNIKNFLNIIIHDHYPFNNIPEDIYKSIYNNTPNETLDT